MVVNSYDEYISHVHNKTKEMSSSQISFLLLWYIQRIDYLKNKYKSKDSDYCDKKLTTIGLSIDTMLNYSWTYYDRAYVNPTLIHEFKEKLENDFEFLTGGNAYCYSIFDILISIESFIDFYILNTINLSDLYLNFYLDDIEKFYDDEYGYDLLNEENFQSKIIQNELSKSMKTVGYVYNGGHLSSMEKTIFWN